MYVTYCQNSISANHNDGSWVIKQQLDTISIYELCGDLRNVMNELNEKINSYYRNYIEIPCEVYEIIGGKFLLGKKYEVRFTSLVIDWEPNSATITGIREPIAEELEFLENYKKEQERNSEEYRRKQFEQLKKEFDSK